MILFGKKLPDMPDRVFTLRPELPHYFWKILAGILLIPLFGYGLYLLFTVYKKRSRTEYQLSDRSITTITPGLTAAVDLANVETVDIVQKFGDKWFNIGTLMVRTDHRTLKLEGVKDPRSEERRVGKGGRARRRRECEKKRIVDRQRAVTKQT